MTPNPFIMRTAAELLERLQAGKYWPIADTGFARGQSPKVFITATPSFMVYE